MRYSVEQGHIDNLGGVSDYHSMSFDAESLAGAKAYVDAKLKEGAFEAWKGGSNLRVWGGGEESICSVKDDFSASWS